MTFIPTTAPETTAGGKPGGAIHPWLWRDTASGRLFLNSYDIANGADSCTGSSGTVLWWSDDDGHTWTRTVAGCDSKDYGKIITGPAATKASKDLLAKNHYPSMVYFCATGPQVLTGPDRMCYRSVDGGKTFTRTKTDAIDAKAGQKGWPNAGAVGPDGTIYVEHVSTKRVAIAISHDEGDPWHDVYIPGSALAGVIQHNWLSTNVTVDREGTLYAVWVDDSDTRPYIAASKDQGATWTKPIMFGAPDALIASYPNVAVKKPGYVALAYYGSSDVKGNGKDGYFQRDGGKYDAYLTVTTDLFAAKPVFWSAAVNDPKTPAIDGMAYPQSEYLGPPTFAHDGSIWAAYVQANKGLTGRLAGPLDNGGAQ